MGPGETQRAGELHKLKDASDIVSPETSMILKFVWNFKRHTNNQINLEQKALKPTK